MMVMIVDKLLKTEIIQCADVANWIFSKEMSKEFTKSYVWEILHLTIRLDFFLVLFKIMNYLMPILIHKKVPLAFQ